MDAFFDLNFHVFGRVHVGEYARVAGRVNNGTIQDFERAVGIAAPEYANRGFYQILRQRYIAQAQLLGADVNNAADNAWDDAWDNALDELFDEGWRYYVCNSLIRFQRDCHASPCA